jgi:hypothetical protein
MLAYCLQVLCYTILGCFTHLFLFISMGSGRRLYRQNHKSFEAVMELHHPSQEMATRKTQLLTEHPNDHKHGR